jgi:hypothetical protein
MDHGLAAAEVPDPSPASPPALAVGGAGSCRSFSSCAPAVDALDDVPQTRRRVLWQETYFVQTCFLTAPVLASKVTM